MSANSPAIHGQSSNVGMLGAAAVLSAVVAVGALGFVIGRSVATTTADRPAAGPVVDSTSMSVPRTAQQKALARHYAAIAALGAQRAAATSGVDGRFAAQYDRYVAVQRAAAIAAELNLTIADPKETGAAIVVSPPIVLSTPATALEAQYNNWLKAQSMAIGTDFPNMLQDQANLTAAAYGGSDFAAAYANWLKAQAATADSAFPDYFQRLIGTKSNAGAYAGTNFAAQYDLWLKAQAAAKGSDFPDWFQRHEAPVAGGSGGRSIRIAQ